MKDQQDVVKEFNEVVNMTAQELEKWLKSDQANSAGWPKEDEDGESVGHDSGRQIVEILKSNPNKDPKKYKDDQIDHMRRVVAYCKRHLAQEEKSNSKKSAEEVKKTKSYASLKNWGHDPLKKRGEKSSNGEQEEEEEEEDGEEEEAEVGDDEEQAGDKRKKDAGAQSGSNKKRETRQGKAAQSNGNDDDGEGDDEDNDDDEDDNADRKGGKATRSKSQNSKAQNKSNGQENGNGDGSGAKPEKGPNPGDTVSWNWGSGNPKGKVLDVKADKATITTKNGNEVSRDGDPEDPAVILDTGKSKAIKSNHELN